MKFKEYLASFRPGFVAVPFSEKFRSGLAALFGMLFMGLALRYLPQLHGYALILLAPMAATSTLLYAVPHSPMSQPWNVFFGHVLSGIVGWGCSLLIPDPVVAGSCAVGLAIFGMHLAHSLHPPGGATALLMVLSATQFHLQGWEWLAVTLLANALLSVLFALIINNLIPGRRYPQPRAVAPPKASPPLVGSPVELSAADVEWALTKMESVIDVSEEDLLEIYHLATWHAIGGGK